MTNIIEFFTCKLFWPSPVGHLLRIPVMMDLNTWKESNLIVGVSFHPTLRYTWKKIGILGREFTNEKEESEKKVTTHARPWKK